jgi:hypothetical protein
MFGDQKLNLGPKTQGVNSVLVKGPWEGKQVDELRPYHTPTILTSSAAATGEETGLWGLMASGHQSIFICSVASTSYPNGVSFMRAGSGSLAASFQADVMYGSGAATIHVDIQHAQKHRRRSSAPRERSGSSASVVSFLS